MYLTIDSRFHGFNLTMGSLFHSFNLTMGSLFHSFNLTIDSRFYRFIPTMGSLFDSFNLTIDSRFHGFNLTMGSLFHSFNLTMGPLFHRFNLKIDSRFHRFNLTMGSLSNWQLPSGKESIYYWCPSLPQLQQSLKFALLMSFSPFPSHTVELGATGCRGWTTALCYLGRGHKRQEDVEVSGTQSRISPRTQRVLR